MILITCHFIIICHCAHLLTFWLTCNCIRNSDENYRVCCINTLKMELNSLKLLKIQLLELTIVSLATTIYYWPIYRSIHFKKTDTLTYCWARKKLAVLSDRNVHSYLVIDSLFIYLMLLQVTRSAKRRGNFGFLFCFRAIRFTRCIRGWLRLFGWNDSVFWKRRIQRASLKTYCDSFSLPQCVWRYVICNLLIWLSCTAFLLLKPSIWFKLYFCLCVCILYSALY